LNPSDETQALDELLYYPGCTMKGQSLNFEESTQLVFEALGYPLRELERWSCCGGVFPLALDNHMQIVSPTRSLALAEAEAQELVTACAGCYNVLKRTSRVLEDDSELLEKLNTYLADEVEPVQYKNGVNVRHITQVLRDTVGTDTLREKMTRSLDGIRMAPYYGCLLLRPPDLVAIDDVEEPTILEELIATTGAEVVNFPYRTECCGAYLVASEPDAVVRSSGAILRAAAERGIQALVASCPLCHHNLEWTQNALHERGELLPTIPILYITQVLIPYQPRP